MPRTRLRWGGRRWALNEDAAERLDGSPELAGETRVLTRVLRRLPAMSPSNMFSQSRVSCVSPSGTAADDGAVGSIVVTFNTPALVVQLWLDASRALRPNDARPLVEVILPYGSVLLVRSTREFWSRWSRPATQLIHRLVYYPLGGPARPWLSVPVMFLVNGAAHYDVSGALVGDRAVWGWNTVFWTMGAAATLEIYLTRAVSARWGAERGSSGSGDEMLRPGHRERRAVEDQTGLPGWFIVARACIAYACGTFAAHTMLTRCLHLSMRSFLFNAHTDDH